jgi:hypothetical protein
MQEISKKREPPRSRCAERMCYARLSRFTRGWLPMIASPRHSNAFKPLAHRLRIAFHNLVCCYSFSPFLRAPGFWDV